MALLTDADVAEYWRHLKAWQIKLGLQDWRIVYSPIPAKKAMAEMDKWDWLQRQVTARVGRDWKSSPINSATLEQTAVHELLHVLLYELVQEAKNPHATEDDLGSKEHRVINALEQLLVPGGE
jgi:hypothetical protein